MANKYLDSTGVKYLWDKIKNTYQPKGNYLTTSAAASTYLGISAKAVSATVADSVAWSGITGKPSSYYTLPTATSSTLGGVKIQSGNVYDYTGNASDVAASMNHYHSNYLTSHQSLANYSTLANTIKSLSISGKTITYTKGDGSTGTLTTQDTTYSNATTTTAGLMSTTDKSNLNTLVDLLADNDSNTTVNTIREVLNVFSNYPEGTNLANALAGKLDKSGGEISGDLGVTGTINAGVISAFSVSALGIDSFGSIKEEGSTLSEKYQAKGNYATTDTTQTISGAKTFSSLITQGAPSNDASISGMNRFEADLFVSGNGVAPNSPKVAGFYLGKSQGVNDNNRHMDIVSGGDYSYIDFNKASVINDYQARLLVNVTTGATEWKWGTSTKTFSFTDGTVSATLFVEGGKSLSDKYQAKGNYLTSSSLSGYATQDWVSGAFLGKSGGTITGVSTIDTTSNTSMSTPALNILHTGPSTDSEYADLMVLSGFKGGPYGFRFKTHGSGTAIIQSQRINNDGEVFPLSLNPNGGNVLMNGKLIATQEWVTSQSYLPKSGGKLTGPTYFDSASGNNKTNNYLSAGGGYSTGSGRLGLKIVALDQSDAQMGMGVDLTGGPYELTVATGRSSDTGSSKIVFATHTTGTTAYKTLATLSASAAATPTATFNVNGTIQESGTSLSSKYQAKLTSGTNIKTVNGTSLLGSGNISISGGAGSVTKIWSGSTVLSDESPIDALYSASGYTCLLQIYSADEDAFGFLIATPTAQKEFDLNGVVIGLNIHFQLNSQYGFSTMTGHDADATFVEAIYKFG